MPKRSQGLMARAVQVMKTPGLFADEKNLYLQVTAGGAKTWIFRYQIAGRRREMGLGSLSLVSLTKARDTATGLRRMVAAGIDPQEARKAEAAAVKAAAASAITFRECALIYIDTMRPGWSNEKHTAQWTTTLSTYTAFGK